MCLQVNGTLFSLDPIGQRMRAAGLQQSGDLQVVALCWVLACAAAEADVLSLQATLQCPQKSMLCTPCFLPVLQLSFGQVLLNVPCPQQTAPLDSVPPRCRAALVRSGVARWHL